MSAILRRHGWLFCKTAYTLAIGPVNYQIGNSKKKKLIALIVEDSCTLKSQFAVL